MNNKYSLLISLCALIVFFSCQKEDFTPPTSWINTPNSNLETIWVAELAENRDFGSLSVSGFIYEQMVFFSDESAAQLNGYNLFTGTKDRELARGHFVNSSSKSNRFLKNNILYYASSLDKQQCLNMQSGNIQTLYNGTSAMGQQVTLSDNVIFFEDTDIHKNATVLFKLNLIDGSLDTIQKFMKGEWQAHFQAPLAINHNGNNLLAIQMRMAGPNATNRQDYYMYDLHGDSLLWAQADFDDQIGSIAVAVSDDERIYWLGNSSVYAFDIETGQLVWEYKNPDQKGHWHGIHFLYNGRYYVKNDGYRFVALKPETGELIFENTEAGSSPGNSYEVFDGTFCFYSKGKGLFQAIDLNTGQTLLSTPPPVKNEEGTYTMASSFVIDHDTRMMYYTNYFDVICVKIPEWEKAR